MLSDHLNNSKFKFSRFLGLFIDSNDKDQTILLNSKIFLVIHQRSLTPTLPPYHCNEDDSDPSQCLDRVICWCDRQGSGVGCALWRDVLRSNLGHHDVCIRRLYKTAGQDKLLPQMGVHQVTALQPENLPLCRLLRVGMGNGDCLMDN